MICVMAALGSAQTQPLGACAESRTQGDVEVLSSPAVSVSFRTAPNSPNVTGVDLWITNDRGATWKKHVENAPPDRPLRFDTAADGEYGLYLILRNSAGSSAAPPSPGTVPQKTVLLDRQAPLVQILSARKDADFAINRDVHLRWIAQDRNLPPRPVWLHYRTAETKAWRLICDSLEAEGSYRWTVPEGLTGRIEIKITAKDLAGNIGRSEIQWRDIRYDPAAGPLSTSSPPAADSPANPTASADPVAQTSDAAAESVSIDPAHRKRTQQLHELGTWHRLRGEYDLARAKLAEAVQLDPANIPARTDLAGVMLLLRDRQAAEREYLEVLRRDPGHAAALKGLAWIQTTEKQYQAALRTLHRLVEIAPEDAEGWIHLGDVLLCTANRDEAGMAWQKAADLASSSPETRAKARKRLEIYFPQGRPLLPRRPPDVRMPATTSPAEGW